MRSILALVAAALLVAGACGAEPSHDPAAPKAQPAGATKGNDALDCSRDQRQALVVDYDPDPDGGFKTPQIALRRQLESESRPRWWPSAEDFRRQEGEGGGDEFVVFEYEQGGRRLALVWVRDLGRSWLTTAYEICKEIFEK